MFKSVFFGVFLFFALLFALCGMLKGRKYKWQFSAARVILLVIATLIATVLSALVGWAAGGVLINFVAPLLEDMGIGVNTIFEVVPSAVEILRAVVAMIVAPLVFILIFNIVRPLVNLLTGPLCKLLLKITGADKAKAEAASEGEAASEEAPAENLESLDDTGAEAVEGAEVVASEESAPSFADNIPNVEGIEGVQMVKTTVITHKIDEHIESTATSKRKKVKKYDKFRSDKRFDPLGALVGAACSVLILVVLLVPFVGAADFANSAVQVVVTPTDDTTEIICEISDAAANNAGAKTVNLLGGKAVWSALTTYPVAGEWTSAPRETEFLSKTASAVMHMNDEGVTRAEAADSIRDLSESFDRAVMIPMLLSDVLSAASESWSAGDEFCGIAAPKLGDTVDPLVKDFFGVMKDSSQETIREDVHTVIDTIALVVEHDAMAAMKGSDDMLALFKNEPLVSGIMLEFLENDRMSSLVGSMTNLGLSMFSEQLDLDADAEGEYDEFILEMYEAYAAVDAADGMAALEELSTKVSKIYDDHGIALSNGVSTCIALDMLDTLESGDKAEIKAFFKSASSSGSLDASSDEVVYLAASDGAASGASLAIISSIAAEADENMSRDEFKALIISEFEATSIEFTDEELDKLASNLVSKMYSDVKSGKLNYKNGAISNNADLVKKSVKITAEDLKVEMTDITDKEKEAKAIAKVFSSTLDTVDQLSTGDIKTSDIIASFGPVLDNFADCQIIGEETTANVLVSILQSEKVRGEIGFTLVQATSMANKINNGTMGDEGYTVLLKSLGTTVDIISTSASSDGNTAEAVEDLMKEITPTSAEVLQELSTPETVKNYGVPDKSADAVSGMMSDMFGNMSSAKEEGRLTEEEYARESAAVSDMMSIAMSATGTGSGSTFGEGSSTNITATEFVDRATDSVIISETLVNTVYGDEEGATVDPLASERAVSDEEKEELVSALDAKWQAQLETSDDEAANAEYQKVLTSIAAIVNVNIAFTADGVVAA